MSEIVKEHPHVLGINRFKDLASLLPETAFQTDGKGRLTFVNQTGFRLFGYDLSDVKESYFVTDFFIHTERERVRKNLELLLEGKSVPPHEYVALRKDDQPFPVIVHGTAVMEDGRCIGSIGLIIDLSYRKQIEKNLRTTEEKYHDIFDNIWDLLCYHELDGNFIEVNAAFKNEFDFRCSKGRPLNLRDIIPERYRHGVEDYLKEVRQNGKAAGIMRVVNRNGEEQLYEYRNTLVFDEGRPIGIRGMTRDITERFNAEKALKKSEERYRSVFEHAGLPLVTMEKNLMIFMVNDRFVEMSGHKKDEIEGRMTFTDFINPEDRLELMNRFSRYNEEKHFEYECRINHRNELTYDVLVRIGHVPGTDQFIASFTDITARKQAEVALVESRDHLHKENILLRSSIRERYRFCDIIGKSPGMQKVYEFILQAAATQANVIIYGESGTGKELVAKAIHETSDRSKKRFVTVHCGAIQENLIESEFFGYKKGSFTSAVTDKRGYLDDADGGTLFLDEVGEISLNMQVKLLRAIAGDGYAPVGSSTTKNTDVRIIAATNRNLRDLVKNGTIREDFFYRMHILPIYLPPLRARKEDLPLLIDHFLHLYDKLHLPLPVHITESLLRYDWPGNVRELQSVLHRYVTLKKLDFEGAPTEATSDPAVICRDTGLVHVDQVQSAENHMSTQIDDHTMNLKSLEIDLIKKALSEHQWHRGRTASALGISRKTLFLKIQKFDLTHP